MIVLSAGMPRAGSGWGYNLSYSAYVMGSERSLSTGKRGRFREVYTPSQQARLLDEFGPFLRKMNYELR